MKLSEIFRMTVVVTPPLVVGPTPLGLRQLIGASTGEVTGDRVAGRLNPGGGDWLLLTSSGYARPDVRHTITTHDGAVLYLTGHGFIEMNEATIAGITGQKPSSFADAYIRLSIGLESGDPRYGWVNDRLFVAEGRIAEGPAIEYVVFEVV